MKYPFKCKDCGKDFEYVAALAQLDLNSLACPDCGSKNIRRVWRSIPVIFKGDGFTKSNKEN